MTFTDMIDTSQGTACGGYTYEVEYLSTGPLYSGSAPDLTHYSIAAGPAVEGTVSNMGWSPDTHPMQLKCTNGVYDATPTARGVNGLFTSVYSSQIDVTVLDPCLTSVVNGDGAIGHIQLSVTSGLSYEVITLSGPTDSVSVTFGNGYDICGDLEYTLSSTNTYTDEYMTFAETVNSGLVDSLAFGLDSFPTGTFVPY